MILGKRTIGHVLEATPYSAVTLSAGDFDFRPYNITTSPEIEMAERFYATSNFDRYESIAGKRMGTIGFSFDLAPYTINSGASAATAPNWGRILESGGLLATAQTATGYTWDTSVHNTNKTATILMQDIEEGNPASAVGLGVTLSGAMCTLKLVLEAVGKPVRADVEFKGRISIADIAAGAVKIPTGQSTVKSPGVLSSTITAFGSAVDIDSMELDFGNVLATIPAPAEAGGYLGVNITDVNPNMTLDPSLKRDTAGDGFWTKWTNETTGAFSMTIGGNITLSLPAIQINDAYKTADRDGNITNPITLNGTRHASLPVVRLLQGAL